MCACRTPLTTRSDRLGGVPDPPLPTTGPETEDVDGWSATRDWLRRDAQGRRILDALATDPEAGVVALRRRLGETSIPPQVTSQVADSSIDKMAAFARADRVMLGDQYFDYSTRGHAPRPLHARATGGIARSLRAVGTLIAAGGVVLTGYNCYQAYAGAAIQLNPAFGRVLTDLAAIGSSLPRAITVPQDVVATSGFALAGVALLTFGRILRP